MPTSEQIDAFIAAYDAIPAQRHIGHRRVRVEAGLSAAEGAKPRVKPLEWMEIKGPNGIWWSARNPLGGLNFEANTIEERECKEITYEARILAALQEGE